MQYQGGKARIAKQIAGYLNEIRRADQPYWEPFVGAASVAALIGPGDNYFSDLRLELVAMLKAVSLGWRPPAVVTEAQYRLSKAGHGPPHLRGFIGFACSFGGRWFEGYARGHGGRNGYAHTGKRGLLAKISTLQGYLFVADFITCQLPEAIDRPMLIYCDPPYENTKKIPGLPAFNHEVFWDRVRGLEEAGHTVVVSEFQAPADFSEVVSFSLSRSLRSNGSKRMTERLFRYDPHGRLGEYRPQLPLEAPGD